MLTLEDLKVGKTYRGKRFQQFPWGNNDRIIVWIGKQAFGDVSIQYDSDGIELGRRLPTVSAEKFLKWAKEEVIK